MNTAANADQQELDKFGEVAHRWWDPNSEFRPLHDINPARVAWIDAHAELKDKRVIDIGCGGGLLSEGMAALADARQGKRTLRTHSVEYKPAPKVTPKELIRVREDLKISRALFAVYLRTNVRTLENWEQGRAKPNAQAALLINLVKLYPDTVQRLATI